MNLSLKDVFISIIISALFGLFLELEFGVSVGGSLFVSMIFVWILTDLAEIKNNLRELRALKTPPTNSSGG